MEQFSIGADLESAAARGDERKRFDALAEFENFGRQTDGLRRVVSNDAVFDRDFGFHPELLSQRKRYRCDPSRSRNVAALYERRTNKCDGHRPPLQKKNPLTISSGSGCFAPFRFAGSAAKII